MLCMCVCCESRTDALPVIYSVSQCAHWCISPTCHLFWWITPDIFTIRRVKHHSFLSASAFTVCSCQQRPLTTFGELPKNNSGEGIWSTTIHLFTSGSRMTSYFSFPTFLFLAPLLLKGLWVSGSRGCASCGLPAMEKDAEKRLMIEIAKQQLLEKLHLKERPNITHTVPRAALLTALRKLHSGRVRQDGTLELENNIPTKDQGYEIVSFADISKFCIHQLYCKVSFSLCMALKDYRIAVCVRVTCVKCTQTRSGFPCALFTTVLCCSVLWKINSSAINNEIQRQV